MKTPELEKLHLSKEALKKTNRRSFIRAALIGTSGFLSWAILSNLEQDRELPWLLRRMNEINDSFWKSRFSFDAKSPPVDSDGKPLRINGDTGILDSIDEANYRLIVNDPQYEEPVEITLDEVKAMPSVNESFEFKCIEGWSQPISCKGVRFRDFMTNFELGLGSKFVGMSSIDHGYYVSWDMKSLMHPQTLICYEMNGVPLKPENGAPLRILSSVKYGVKQMKQLGSLTFSQSPQPDYWAEQGYSEYLGL